jgi:hypothetical protein
MMKPFYAAIALFFTRIKMRLAQYCGAISKIGAKENVNSELENLEFVI